MMKAKFYYALFLVSAGFAFCSNHALAQDGLPSNEVKELNYHQELNLNDDKTLLLESESKSVVSSSKENNSAAQKNTTTKTKVGDKAPVEKEGADALSSNFLYLIIQKFKISDILD